MDQDQVVDSVSNNSGKFSSANGAGNEGESRNGDPVEQYRTQINNLSH